MAAIPVTLDGTLYDLYGRTTQRVIIFADASLTGLGVGGGPIVPPGQPQPPGVWPGPGPSHPIVLPGDPSWGTGTQPPVIWPGPHPEHPINLPGGPSWPGEQPPPPSGGAKPPPPDGGWGYHPEYGWGYFPGGGGKPQPVPPASAKK